MQPLGHGRGLIDDRFIGDQDVEGVPEALRPPLALRLVKGEGITPRLKLALGEDEQEDLQRGAHFRG